MKVPVSWLREFVDINIPVEKLAERLCNVGIIVDKIEYSDEKISGVAAGKITKIEKHENADKLRVAQVEIGKENLQIVTGAQNVKQGDIIPVALVGAHLAGGLAIKKSQLRGVDSFGMMCSAKELGIDIKELPPDEQQGVMILPSYYKTGTDLADFLNLNDPVLLIEPFANRPDCLSIIGIAYEAAYVMGEALKTKEFNLDDSQIICSDFVNVRIQDYNDCPRYTARIIKDVNIKPSDLKMKLRLNAVGIRSVNNIVDITNYVMMETGHPMHAFDYDKITGSGVKDITIRRAKRGEHIITIDEQDLKLDDDILVIADSSAVIALAGVMGGKASEVSDSTKNILLEAALFDPFAVRKSSVKFNLKSESSKRFEKGLDFYMAETASKQAAVMMSDSSIAKGYIDNFEKMPTKTEIEIKIKKINNILGSSFKGEDLMRKFTSIGFNAEINSKEAPDENLKIQAPFHRSDIKEEIDIVEEAARLSGYDNIGYTLPNAALTCASYSDELLFEKRLKVLFEKHLLSEIKTYTMLDSQILEKFKFNTDNCLKIINPLSSEQSIMRPALIPSITLAADYNLRNKNEDLFLFEISHIYTKNNAAKHCAGILCDKDADFFNLKAILENIFKSLNLKVKYAEDKNSLIFHPGINANIFYEDTLIGHFGKLHPEIIADMEINKDIFAFELRVDELFRFAKPIKYKDFSRYPAVMRDLAVIIDKDIKCAEIEKIITSSGGQALLSCFCFDEYSGEQTGKNKKSLAFSLTYQLFDRTLKDDEVNKSLEDIKSALKEKLSAHVRE